MCNKERYKALCEKEKTIPIFSQFWWLDAVCGEDNWDVVLLEKGGEVVASFPYYIEKKYSFKMITMPKLTQKMGIWIKYPPGQTLHSKLSFEKEIFTELIEKLSAFDIFRQNFNYSITNWLPFYWKGFEQTTKYTYVIEDLSNLDEVYNSFRSNIKTDIKKALKITKTYCENNISKFYEINKKTFARQKLDMPYSLKFLDHLDSCLDKRECRKIFFAEDEKGNIHCGLYLIWDSESAYYLMGGGDPLWRNSGATSLLMWEAIKFSQSVTKRFDLEGSMLEPVERFFRAFGGSQKQYFHIYSNSKKARLFISFKDIVKIFFGVI